MAAKKDLVPVRVLCGFPLEGREYKPGQLVGFSAEQVDQLKGMGAVDPGKDALAACKAAGYELFEHSPADAQESAEEG